MKKDNFRGIIWLTMAMAAYAVEDALFKAIIREIPVGQALILFSLGGVLFFSLILKMQRRPLLLPEVCSLPMFIRSACEVIGRLSYLIGLAFVPLSTATVIIQSIPIVMLIGKAMRTGEISIMMPFRYTRLVFGVSIGVLVFGEKIYLNTLMGSSIIVFSGLLIWFYETRLIVR